jgi:hypothetical protein
MLFKKLLLFALITSSTCTVQAASSHEIRTWGVVTAGLLVTWAGVHVLIRQNHDITNRMLDTILGLALIAAGLSGIVMSDKITRHIEHALS